MSNKGLLFPIKADEFGQLESWLGKILLDEVINQYITVMCRMPSNDEFRVRLCNQPWRASTLNR